MKVLHVFTLMWTAEFLDGQFKFLSDKGYDMHLACCYEENPDFLTRNNLKYHQVDVARRVDIKADLKTIKQLVELIKKEKFDAVFGHTPKGAMVAMISSYIAGVKTRVYYRHGLIYTTTSGFRKSILKLVERLTGWLATDVVNVSPSLSALAEKDYLNNVKRQTVIGSGTCCGLDTIDLFNPDLISDTQKSELREKLGIKRDDLVFGFVGRICKEKGIREIVDGFEEFRIKHPEIDSKLLLVGNYDERDILPDIYKLKIHNNQDIISTGLIAHKDLPLYYSIMDAFIFPSYREGFGMTVIEASAMGMPALVSRSHGCIDAIRENVTGLYIDISREGILAGMEKLLDPGLRQRLGKGGILFAQTEFEQKDYWEKVLDFYKVVMPK